MPSTDPQRRPRVTLEEARLMHEHGISLRTDGKWGYKKLCANPKCDKRREDSCHCADTLADAVRLSKERSDLTQDWACFVDSRFAMDWCAESEQDWLHDPRLAPFVTLVKHDDCDDPTMGPYCECCASGDDEYYVDWEGMRLTDRSRFDDLLREFVDGADFDGDPDECSCEVPA